MGALHTIEIRNFKAFRDFTLPLDGRHLLLYGANGSGKSSLFWALHAFLESAGKTQHEVQKYFDPAHKESLVNIDANPLDTAAALLKLTVEEGAGIKNCYEISHDKHDTADKPQITKALLASDFITYRFFFKFSNFTNRDPFEIWRLFEHEILPFCATTSSPNLREDWQAICKRCEDSVTQKSRGKAANNDKTFLETNTVAFATNLEAVITSIATEAKDFYAKHFAKDDAVPLELHLTLATKPAYHHSGKRLELPRILFGITKAGAIPRNIERPQTFLNEAKLTQIAISIRLAASLVMLKQSPLKLLVLDDLLVSLDMSNRMKVVEIILSKKFADYQKIILTHDLSFFREFVRSIGDKHPDWAFRWLNQPVGKNLELVEVKQDLKKAEEYLHGQNLDEAAVCLRKVVENTMARYLNPVMTPTSDFRTLTENLKAARNKILGGLPATLYEKVLKDIPDAHRSYLISADDTDIAGIAGLTEDERTNLERKRKDLRKLLKGDLWKKVENAHLIDDVLRMTERVLNPAAHAVALPLYQKEVADAHVLIAKLEKCLA